MNEQDKVRYELTALLLRYTNSAPSAASGLCVLSTHTNTQVMTDTTVSPDLLQTLKVISELDIQSVRRELCSLSISDIFLSVEEPVGDLELTRVRENGNHLLNVFCSKFTSSFVKINVCLLANKVGEPATATLDGGKSIHHFTLTLNVGILNTKNVLEVVLHDKGPHLRGCSGREAENSPRRDVTAHSHFLPATLSISHTITNPHLNYSLLLINSPLFKGLAP